MSDAERKRRNAAKMRDLINLLETRTYDTLSKSDFFDVEIHLSVRDGAIQEHVEVTIRHKDRLD